ncbi:hypothetical protein I553_7341 [Mycobacterium xenopi 4042]|uniref:Uncharacterized protein n=1 Tax=Mycobacterium xenopi 4042 TaxID=1299334 RepID=X8E917_MYCXE|nr:hypothetical protein I553_7341 [Mycobacterium xenopi 4042]
MRVLRDSATPGHGRHDRRRVGRGRRADRVADRGGLGA